MIRKATTHEGPSTAISEEVRRRRQELLAEAHRLYASYGKPLEQDHWGKFLAVSRDGRTIIGDDLDEVSAEAATVLGRGSFLFKIGEIAVGKIR